MKLTHLYLVLGAVVVTTSPVPREGDSVEVTTSATEEHAHADLLHALAVNSAYEELLADFEDRFKTITPRASAPTEAPTFEWGLEVDDEADEADEDDETPLDYGSEDGVEALDSDDSQEGNDDLDGSKKKKPKKPKKCK